MGTRGLYGFRMNGLDKTTYNHFDSYPDILGRDIVNFCSNYSADEMKEIFKKIILVSELDTPTNEQIVECKQFANLSVYTKRLDDWYCLLRNSQGKLEPYTNGLRYMIDNSSFIKESLFCEYAYIINLDENVLEYWMGFQTAIDETNRYGTELIDNYRPCKLMKTYDLNSIFNNVKEVDAIVEHMNYLVQHYYDMEEKDV